MNKGKEVDRDGWMWWVGGKEGGKDGREGKLGAMEERRTKDRE